MANQLKTALLLGALGGLFVGLGAFLGGRNGAVLGLLFAAVLNMGAYWFSDKIALKMSKAKPLSEAEAPEVFASVRNLSQSANLPMPALYLIPSDQPNAFATGRNPAKGVVAVTRGLLKMLSRDEVEGVLAHELAHIQNRDILIASVAATIAAAVSWVGTMARWGAMFGGDDDDSPFGFIGIIVTTIVAGLAAVVIQLSISRSREYLADASGARISGRPESLASALQKIEGFAKQTPMAVNPASEPLYIINPLRSGKVSRFFSTHPPTSERVHRLEQLVGRV